LQGFKAKTNQANADKTSWLNTSCFATRLDKAKPEQAAKDQANANEAEADVDRGERSQLF
jgi:hypothetical protein